MYSLSCTPKNDVVSFFPHFKPPSVSNPVLSPSVCFFREYSSRFSSEDTLLFCMRVMVGVIILYDHVHPNGAFNKSSKIDVRHTLTLTLLHTWKQRDCGFVLWCCALIRIVFLLSDERLHKSPEGPAGRQRRRPPERPQVGYIQSMSVSVLGCQSTIKILCIPLFCLACCVVHQRDTKTQSDNFEMWCCLIIKAFIVKKLHGMKHVL